VNAAAVDPRTRLLLEGPIAPTLLRMALLINAAAVAGGVWFGPLGRPRRPGWWAAPAGQG
jgi:hypothetical protein